MRCDENNFYRNALVHGPLFHRRGAEKQGYAEV